jgi:hypothetical protein
MPVAGLPLHSRVEHLAHSSACTFARRATAAKAARQPETAVEPPGQDIGATSETAAEEEGDRTPTGSPRVKDEPQPADAAKESPPETVARAARTARKTSTSTAPIPEGEPIATVTRGKKSRQATAKAKNNAENTAAAVAAASRAGNPTATLDTHGQPAPKQVPTPSIALLHHPSRA